MGTPVSWTALDGKWSGVNRLWLSPGETARLSDSTAVLKSIAAGQILLVAYTWAEEGLPQSGTLVVNRSADGALEAYWADSWHMRHEIMACRGTGAEEGSLAVQGTYAAPPGPDWGWKIVLEATTGDTWRMRMYNLPPEGQEDLAVEMALSRRQ